MRSKFFWGEREEEAADEPGLYLIAALTVAGGLASMVLKNTVHCALALTLLSLGWRSFF